ncbi:MAG: phage tail protein [Collimonas pratensis]
MQNIVGYGGGKGSGGGSTATELRDSLHSIAYAKVLDLISEGEIRGPANGLQSVFLNETPLQNPDGSSNFKSVTVDFRSGVQTQDVISGFPSVENELGIGVELKSSAPWVHAVNNLQLSAVRIRLSVSGLSKADTSNGNINGYRIDYVIEVSTDTGAYQPVITAAFDGKTTSKYERSHRVNLPKAAQGWTVRVRRITPNANSSSVADTTTITSITEVIDAKLRYPMSALVGVQVDASQFQSVPTRSYDMYGRIIKVPSNYDPATRIYSGVWDGTFKPAWTDNPAWVFYDLVLNDRYGLGHLVNATQVSKWSLYQIAQYCDVLVPDGKGGTEPRFTCNLYLQSRAAAYKVLQDLASIFRGVAYWSSGSIVASSDLPSDPAYVYTAANVIDGKFTRVGSSKKTRHTVALVSWNDPADFYRAKVEYLQDDDGVARYGVQQLELTAFGCTSQAQAQRAGNWALLTSRLEAGTITFSVGLDGVVAAPGQIVRVADPHRMGRRNAGRIRTASGRTVTLDKAAVIAVGDKLTVMLPTAVSETRVVQSIAGDAVTVSQDWSQLPQAQAIWSADSIDLVAPMYKIFSVVEKEGLTYEISATQHEPGKYAYIDNGTRIEPRPESGIGTRPAAPINLQFSTFPYWVDDSIGGMNATLSWTGAGANYLVSWRKAFGAWTNVYTREPSFDISNAVIGAYEFSVVAISSVGLESPAATLNTSVVAELPPLDDVTGLMPEGAFSTDTAKIKWDAVKGATSYSVQVLAGNPTFIARQVNVGNALRFDYSAADMRTDGGPWRSVVFKVKALGKFGTTSKNWTQIIVSNPQIGPLQGIQMDAAIRAGYFQCKAPVDGDFSGIMVWLGTTADFIASEANLVYDGPDCFVTVKGLTDGSALAGGTTYYVRAAGYDTFGRDNLAVSPSIAFQPLANAPDANTIGSGMIKDGALDIGKFASGIEPIGVVATPPDPAGYIGAKVVLNQADGKVYRLVNGAWTASTSATDLAGQLQNGQIGQGAVTADKLNVNIGGGNQCINSSFEKDADSSGMSAGWGYYHNDNNGTFYSHLTDGRRAGTRAQLVGWNGGQNQSSRGVYANAVAGGWLPNKTYVLSYYAKGHNTALGNRMSLGWNVGPSTTLWLNNPPLTLDWQRYAFCLTFGDKTESGMLFLTIDWGQGGIDGAICFDDVQIEEGDIPTGYAPQPDEILPGAVGADQIANGAISAVKTAIAAIDPNSGNLTVNSVTARTVAAGAIAAVNIQAEAITARELAADSVVAGKLAVGAVNARAIGADSIVSNALQSNVIVARHMTADSVMAGTVAAGAINTRELAAGAVTTAKLTIGDFSNLIENPDFTLGDTSWIREAGWSIGPSNGMNGSGVAICYSPVASAIRNNYAVKVTAGDTFYAKCYAALNVRSELCYVRIVGRNAAGAETVLAAGNNANASAPTWILSEVTATVPPGIISVRLDVVGVTPSGASVSGCGLFRMSGATLIQDGAITTNKVAASSITGDKIVGNTITGDKVIANTLTGDKFVAGSVSANVLTSGVGSGNLIYNAAFTAQYKASSGLLVPDGYGVGSDFNTNPYVYGINYAGDPWHPVGVDCIAVLQNGVAPNDNQWVMCPRVPVVQGAWYEASAYTGAHTCNVRISIGWIGGNGAWVSFSEGNSNAQEASGGTTLAGYKRLFALAQAPAGAVQAVVLVYKNGTIAPAAGGSWLFMCMPYMAVANGPNQSQPSPWSPPGIGTQIHGGAIKTSTITADRLAVTELSAITANIGLLRSAASGARFELSTTGLVVYDVNGNERVRVGYLP